MKSYEIRQASSLEKIFLNNKSYIPDHKRGSMLKGEEYSYQIAFSQILRNEWGEKTELEIKVESELKDYVTVRLVKNVPSELPAYKQFCDDGYITVEPGLFPDALMPVENNLVDVVPNIWQSLWISVKIPEDFGGAGEYDIKVILKNNEFCGESVFNIEIIDAVLPKQELIFTQWFHSDCVADAHNVEIDSDKHWTLLEKYIKTAADNGINMLLTPVFTLPLDTQIGGERPTFQLVGVKYDGGYSFDFTKLEKWIDICLKNGIEYFEISHLFTQWGAKCTPKIEVFEKGEVIKKFGWHINSDDESYVEFIDSFLPSLTAFLKEKGIAEKTYFHISDEPNEEHLKSYEKARSLVKKHLEGFKIIDALSDIEFYKKGLIDIPVPGTDHIELFLNEDIEERWTYYCCGQAKKVANRFFAMPSARNRVIGAQLYKFDIKGFLQWGYNFYYSKLSKRVINPYATTDADGAFPSGDAFSVYPYEDGVSESLRLKVFKDALQDMRAMKLLEKYKGKAFVLDIIEKEAKTEISFDNFPYFGNYVILYRERINEEIKKCQADKL